MKLYANELSPFAQMVELYLKRKGLDYEPISPTREFVRGGGFREINPLGKIPTLVIDGFAVPETQVIFELIDDLQPEPALGPADTLEKARMRLLCRTADIYLATPMIQLLNNHLDQKSKDIADYCMGLIQRGVDGLEAWIGEGPYAMGEQPTLADCVLPPVLFHMKFGLPGFGISGHPTLGPKAEAYFAAIQADGLTASCLQQMKASLDQRIAGLAPANAES